MTRDEMDVRIRMGEICQVCRATPTFHPRKEPATCVPCLKLQHSAGEESHRFLTRCPACGSLQTIEDYLGEEERAVACHACDADYMVKVAWSVKYTSPARLKPATEVSTG